MSDKRIIKRNIIWSSAGLVAEIATGFLALPFLVAKLGSEMYGVWLILGSLTVYLSMLEMGVRGSIGRHISLYHARGDQRGVNQILAVGATFLFCTGIGVLLSLFLCEPLFFQFYAIPEGEYNRVSLTYRLMAVNVAVVLVGTAFDAALWGYQRFDWLNAIDIPFLLARTALTFALVRSGSDITTLGAVTLVLWTGSTLCKALLTFRADPNLSISIHHLSRSSFRELLGYGSWNIIGTFARLSRTQLGPILLGSFLGLAIVPIYAIAARLLAAVVAAMNAATGALTPHATALHATDQTARQRQLFLVGGRHAAALSTFLIAYLFILGAPLITLWVGPSFSSAAALLTILLLGESLPCTQYVTNGIILATARHRSLAAFALLETITTCVLMACLLPILGLIGAGVSLSVPAFIFRGIAPLIHGCRITGLSVRRYLIWAIAPSLLCAIPPLVTVQVAITSHPVTSWGGLVGYSIMYTAFFGISYTVVLNRYWLTRLTGRASISNQPPALVTKQTP